MPSTPTDPVVRMRFVCERCGKTETRLRSARGKPPRVCYACLADKQREWSRNYMRAKAAREKQA